MKHVLVVGGTGILEDVSLRLLNNGYHVSTITSFLMQKLNG